MIIILKSDLNQGSPKTQELLNYLSSKPGINTKIHEVVGDEQAINEVYVLGNTKSLNDDEISKLPAVKKVVRVSRSYAVLGRHSDDNRSDGFDYNGVTFDQDNLQIFAGLCAVDNPTNVENMMAALQDLDLNCTRMGAYKPRTNPYSFQGHGPNCLPYVFELAGKYGIKVIAMEVTHDSHIAEIQQALKDSGNATGVMLQIGTRNTQNFELLKACGRQQEMPVLVKRGFGITLDESLNATEYLASEGNRKVIFCLRGMKTNMGDPHRNFIDFSHVPVIKRLTHMPVCIDPSHSVGSRDRTPDGIMDVFHATAQGVVAGANMILVDFHPKPLEALVDGPQALRMNELEWFVNDIRIAREAYLARRKLADQAMAAINQSA